MGKLTKFFALLITFSFFMGAILQAQNVVRNKGVDFWLGFSANHCTSGCTNNNAELNITSNVNTSGYIISPSGWSTTFSVTANTITTVTVPTSQVVWAQQTVESKGLHIVSQDSIVVFAANYKTGSSDGAVIFEKNSLDTNHLISTYQSNHNYMSHFLVVGAENNTTVTITPSQATSMGNAAGVPFTVNLDTGETYMVWANADLSGSEVTSDKPIAVFGSARCADVPASCDYCDALYEQMIPTDFWGTNYVTGKLSGRSGGDFFRILASKNNTTVNVNGTPVATLNRGQFYSTTLDNGNWISASGCKPIGVFQYSRGRNCDATTGTDPFLIQLVPTSLYGNFYHFTTSAPSLSISHHVTITTQTDDTGLVQLDGSPISPNWNPCGGSGWSYAMISVASGAHTLGSDSLLGAIVYGWSTGGSSTSYGYQIGADNVPGGGGVLTAQFSTDSVCSGDTVQFSDNTVGTPNSWKWHFGDGDSSTQPNPGHVYANCGTYNARLIVSNQCAGPDTFSKPVRVGCVPTAKFESDTPCLGQPMTFVDSSSGSASGWVWYFGDGDSSSAQNPNHIYPNDSIYNVQLVAINDTFGCQDTTVQPVEVADGPISSFVAPTVCVGDTTQFTDATSGSPVSWQWMFGDGDTAMSQNPAHYYATDSQYTVILITESPNGCRDTLVDTAVVNPEPQAQFAVDTGCVQDTTQFIDMSSGFPTNWSWDFGDGNTASQQNPNHVYSSDSSYWVELVVQNGMGCLDTTYQQVNAYTSPKPGFITNTACLGDTTYFTDTTSGNISGWTWKFGDGDTAQQQSPAHVYANDSTFNATLIATTDNGCRDSVIQSVTVNSLPAVQFTADTACHFDTTAFTDLTTGSPVSWKWKFGDGDTSNIPNPTHYYNTPGTYTATLLVQNGSNCVDSLKKTVVVNDLPVPQFNTNAPVCEGDTLQVGNNSYGTSAGIDSCYWNFGDGNTSGQCNITHTYTNPGTYTVRLIVQDSNNCSNARAQNLYIAEDPEADFNNTTVCEGDTMSFVDNTVTDTSDNVTSWAWELGDGNTATSGSFDHYYDTAGFYNVQLVVETQYGCRDTVNDSVRVYTTPLVSFDAAPYAGCAPLIVDFSNFTQPTSGLNYKWYFGDGDSSGLETPTHSFDSAGQYNIILQTQGVGNCRAADTVLNMVTVYENPFADFMPDPQVTTISQSTIDFQDLSSNNVISWGWKFGTGDTALRPSPTYIYEDTGTYPVLLTVNTSNGCVDTVEKLITILPEVNLYIPSAFSPNGDGQNDVFRPVGFFEGMKNYKLSIWNRWGEKIFESKDHDTGWNGRKFNTGQPVQNGVYLYLLNYTDVKGNQHDLKGYVFVTR